MDLKILLLLGILGVLVFSGFRLLSTGGTFLSVSVVEFSNQAPGGIKPPVWAVTFIAGGMGQHLEGYVSSNQLKTPDGSRAQYGFKFYVDLLDAKYRYPIYVDNNEKQMATYFMKTWTCLFASETDAYNNCGSNWIAYGKFPISFECFCVGQEKREIIGYLGSPIIYTRTKFTIATDDGKTFSNTIESYGNVEGKVGDYAYVKYTGTLTTRYAPSTSLVRPFYDGNNKIWLLGSESKYQEYKTARNNLEYYIFSTKSPSKDTLQNLINNVNNKYYAFIGSSVPYEWQGYKIMGRETSGSYALVPFNLADATAMYVAYISADLLKIVQPFPKPKIESIYAYDTQSGKPPKIYVTIKNEGDKGNINIYGYCSISSIYPQIIGFNAGETKQIILTGTTGTVSSTVTDTCTIQACGSGTTNCDSKQVSFKISPIQICTPYQTRCSPSVNGIEQCSVDGSAWNVIKYCSSNEKCDIVNGQPTCVPLEGVAPKICTPLQKRCSVDGKGIEQCSVDGKSWLLIKQCQVNEKCDIVNGEPTCIALSETSFITIKKEKEFPWLLVILGIVVVVIIVLAIILIFKK